MTHVHESVFATRHRHVAWFMQYEPFDINHVTWLARISRRLKPHRRARI